MTRKRRILVFAPHDDDVVLGLGGYLHKCLREDIAEITIHVFAMGGPSSNVSSDIRVSEFYECLKVLGMKESDFIRIKVDKDLDGKLDSIPVSKMTSEMDHYYDTIEPDEVFCNYNSVHPDHQALYRAFLGSMRLRSGFMPRNVYLYEYPFILTNYVSPVGGKVYQELTDEDITIKCRAFEAHKSQLKPFPSPLGIKGITTLAEARGLECGAKYAECYYGYRLKKY